MSNLQFGISIKAYNHFSRVMDNFSTKMDDISRSTKTAQSRFRTFQNATSGVTSSLRTLGVVAGVAFSGLAVGVIKTGSDFEQALMGLKAMTGQTTEAVDDLGNTALDLSEKFGSGATGIVTAMTRIASVKSSLMDNVEGLKEYTDATGMLAKISETNFETAGTSLVTMLNIFAKNEGKTFGKNPFGESIQGMDVKKSILTPVRAIDMLAKSAQKGSMKINQLKQAISVAGGTGSMIGLTFAETQGTFNALARSGMVTSMVARQSRNIFLKLNEEVPQLAEGTISYYDALTRIKKLNLPTNVIAKWIGSVNISGWNALMENLDFAKDLTKKVQMNAKGSAQVMFNDVTGTLTEKFKRLRQAVNKEFILIYEPFKPILKKMVDGLRNIVKWLGSGSMSSKLFIGSVGGALAIVTASVVALGVALTAGTFTLWAQTALPAIYKVAGAMALATGGMSVVIPAVLAGIALLIGAMSFFRSDGEKGFFETLTEDLTDLFNVGKTVFFAMAGWAIDLMSAFDIDLGPAFKIFGTILKGILIVIVAIVSALLSIVAIVESILITGFKALLGVVTFIVNFLSDWFEEIYGFELVDIFNLENIEKAIDYAKTAFDKFSAMHNDTVSTSLFKPTASLSSEEKQKFNEKEPSFMETAGGTLWDAMTISPYEAYNRIAIYMSNEDGKVKVLKTEGNVTNLKIEDETGTSQMNPIGD